MTRYRRKKPKKTNAAVFWVILLLAAAAFVLVWWIWSCFYNVTPRFNYLLLQKNGQPLKILNGEVLELHPRDRLKIQEISTTVCLNRGIRLTARDIDISALRYQEMVLSDLLPSRDILKRYSFRVTVKYEDQNLGHFDLVVEPLLADWLDKASRTINAKRKIAILEKALALAPQDTSIKKRLLKEYEAQKNWPKASEILEGMAKANPSQDVLDDLLEVYGAMGNTPGTIRVLQQLVKMRPDDLKLRLRLAAVLEKTHDLKGAIQAYEEILLKGLGKEDRPQIYKTLGFLYTQTKQFQKAISSYRKAVDLNKGDVNLYHNLSLLYEQVGDSQHADEFLAKVVEMRPRDTEGRLKLAKAMIQKKDFQKAEKYLHEVLKADPKSLEALLLTIQIQEVRGDKEGLKKTYRKILVLEPGNENIIYNLAVLEYQTGKLDKSLSYLKIYVKSHPKDPDIHALLLDIYKKKGERGLACKESRTLLLLRPKEKDNYAFQLDCLDRSNDFKGIIEISKQGLKYYPEDISLREYLILGYLKTGKSDLAMTQMKEILKRQPGNASMLLQLAKLQEKEGLIKEALDSYRTLLKISPGNDEAKKSYPRLLLDFAKTLEAQGNTKQAIRAYERLLEFSPNNVEAQQAYLRLRLQVLSHEK